MAANTVSRESYAYTGFVCDDWTTKYNGYEMKQIVKRTASNINEINSELLILFLVLNVQKLLKEIRCF